LEKFDVAKTSSRTIHHSRNSKSASEVEEMPTMSSQNVRGARLLQRLGVALLGSAMVLLFVPRIAYGQSENEPEHRATASFGAGVTLLVGGISNSLNNGWHIAFDGGVNVTRHFQTTLEYAYNGYGVGSRLLREAQVPDGNSHLWWLTVNPKLRLKPIHNVDPYIVGGVGYYRRTIEFTRPAAVPVLIFDPIFGTFFNAIVPADKVLGDITDDGPGGSLGAGLDFKVGESGLKVFTEARYHYASTGRVPTRMVPVTFGVRW
jgi:opacity protein-like surface antigen